VEGLKDWCPFVYQVGPDDTVSFGGYIYRYEREGDQLTLRNSNDMAITFVRRDEVISRDEWAPSLELVQTIELEDSEDVSQLSDVSMVGEYLFIGSRYNLAKYKLPYGSLDGLYSFSFTVGGVSATPSGDVLIVAERYGDSWHIVRVSDGSEVMSLSDPLLNSSAYVEMDAASNTIWKFCPTCDEVFDVFDADTFALERQIYESDLPFEGVVSGFSGIAFDDAGRLWFVVRDPMDLLFLGEIPNLIAVVDPEEMRVVRSYKLPVYAVGYIGGFHISGGELFLPCRLMESRAQASLVVYVFDMPSE